MSLTSSNGFNKYEVTDTTIESAKRWENSNMYKTSYFKQSEKNVLILIYLSQLL